MYNKKTISRKENEKMRTINGKKYDEFLDGFMGGAYGVSRNGRIGVDKSGRVFTGKGVSETDKKLVEYKVKEETDPDNRNLYRNSAAKLRESDPTHTVSAQTPLSDYKILDNPSKELYTKNIPSPRKNIGNGLGLGMLREATTSIPQEMRNPTAPKQVAPAVNQRKATNKPNTFFREAPAWTKPAAETDYPTVNSARKYAKEIIDKQFSKSYRGIDTLGQVTSPRLQSEGLKAKREKEYAEANESNANFYREVTPYAIDLGVSLYQNPTPLGLAEFVYSQNPTMPGISDFVGTAIIDNIPNFAEKKASEEREYYSKLLEENSDYLVHDKKMRDQFIGDLYKKLDEVDRTENFGFASTDENSIYKEEVKNELLRMITLNTNYDNAKKRLDFMKKDIKKQ